MKKPVPLAIDERLLEKVQAVAKMTGRSQADVMRLAMEVGLLDLETIKGDVACAIKDQAAKERAALAASILAEDSPTYSSPKRKRAS